MTRAFISKPRLRIAAAVIASVGAIAAANAAEGHTAQTGACLEDAATVRAISRDVRSRMQEAIDGMLKRRKSIFFGSLFHGETP